jgi:hypothetical protein
MLGDSDRIGSTRSAYPFTPRDIFRFGDGDLCKMTPAREAEVERWIALNKTRRAYRG